MKENVILLILKYAESEKYVINETSGEIPEDLFKLHEELYDIAQSLDGLDIDYFRDVFPRLDESIRWAYEHHYENL